MNEADEHVGAPLAVGMVLGAMLGERRDVVALWAGRLGTAALAIGIIIILYVSAPQMAALIGGGVLWATVAITGFALLAGHLLGGPSEGNRGALAVASAARHPGVAIAVASGAFPADRPAITGAVLLYLVAGAIVAIPYMRWRKRVMAL